MNFLIINADTPTGFYLIEYLTDFNNNIDALIVGDGDGDNFIRHNTTYINPIDIKMHTLKSNNYDAIFFVVDTHRIYNDYVELVYSLIYFEIHIIAIFDWEMFNGVKRGNFPVSTATSTNPDNFRGISKVWIKDTLLHVAKTTSIPISILVTPTVLSPFHLTENIRKDAKYYLAQKLWEIIESFKMGTTPCVNKGDLKVIYDIIHNADVAKAAIDLFNKNILGYYMLSSDKYLRFSEILETFYGRLVQGAPIKLKKTGIEIVNRRRSIENYDTTIDMVHLWTNTIYHSQYSLEVIFDDIIHVLLNIEKEYEIIENVFIDSY